MAPNNLLADVIYDLDGPGPKITDPTTQLEKIISQAIGILTIIAVIFFSIQIIFAGYSFISASGDSKKLEEARHSITNGILGLFIVVIAVGLGSLLASLFGIQNPLNLNEVLTNMGLPQL
ncbi:MAG: hypothetical protein WC596_03425 [Candidatus Shapirobacteria bacterium]